MRRSLYGKQFSIRVSRDGCKRVESNLNTSLAIVVKYNSLSCNGGHQGGDTLLPVDKDLLAFRQSAVFQFHRRVFPNNDIAGDNMGIDMNMNFGNDMNAGNTLSTDNLENIADTAIAGNELGIEQQ